MPGRASAAPFLSPPSCFLSPQDISPAPEIRQFGPHNVITIRAVGTPGHYIGFDVLADDKLVAPARFTSRELIACPNAVAVTQGLTSTLTFDDLQADEDSGVKLEHSRVKVTLVSQKYPRVDFAFHIAAFSARQWEYRIGDQPFHFLTLAMPDATVWHQRGWLHATPRADLFPLLLDVHNGTPELSAFSSNREWSATPPLSAHPLPVIGLWSPARKVYAAWDFQAARQEDHSERDIATGFCNRLIVPDNGNPHQPQEETFPPSHPVPDPNFPQGRNGQPPPKRDPRTRLPLTFEELTSRELDQRGMSKFVALVYPSGGKDYRQREYPKSGAHIASHATLAFHMEMPGTDDPNRFLWQTWWDNAGIRSRLAHVPALVDLARIAGAQPLANLPAAPGGSVLGNADLDFYIPGSLFISGLDWHNESAVDAPAREGDKERLAQLNSDAAILLKYAKHFTLDKEPCVYWEKPLAGEWLPEWGGDPATTLHNANGWAAARLLLDMYRSGKEEEKRKQGEEGETTLKSVSASLQETLSEKKTRHNTRNSPLLPLIDGVFYWAKHVVWTRGDFDDAPASASVTGSPLAVSFLLDYYFTFKDDLLDGEHRVRALQALDMAQSFTYRGMIFGTGADNGSEDADGAFLWQTRAGQKQTGTAELSKISSALDTLAQTAVHTGDPVLLWALQGSLNRLSQTTYSVSEPGAGQNPANTTRAEETAFGGRKTARTEANQIETFLNMTEPVGNTSVRVLCGEKAALAFDRGTRQISISNYRCTGTGDFAFTVRNSGSKTAVFGATITFPYADLSRKSLFLRRGSITQRALRPGTEIAREPNALWSLIVNGLRDGDTVVVGNPDLSRADKLPCAPPLLQPVSLLKSVASTLPSIKREPRTVPEVTSEP